MVLIRKHWPSNLCKCASYKRDELLDPRAPPSCLQRVHIIEKGMVIVSVWL